MVYAGFNGNKVGSDVLLSVHLIQQGLKTITDTYDASSRRKALSARRTIAKSITRRVHDMCVCGEYDLVWKSSPALRCACFEDSFASCTPCERRVLCYV